MYLIGYDIGSSSVKAALVSAETGKAVRIVQSPEDVMPIASPQQGWAEQDPEMWWKHVCLATKKLLSEEGIPGDAIAGIGISYQMHGLVCVDKNQQVLRPSIIWCDSRAVEIGDRAFDQLGHDTCLSHLLNSPGNFTASKLRWVQEHEPEMYARIHRVMLPGDYIAMRLSGEPQTTASGLSEGIFWDFTKDKPADFLLDHYRIDAGLLSGIVPTIGFQAAVSEEGANATGLKVGTPIGYRAGDQPNNAMSLNVLAPGEIAATGGTSGVIYGVLDKPAWDAQSRVNGFLHVNHAQDAPRIGVLLCINGAGIQHQWMKDQVGLPGITYLQMEEQASAIPVGSDGLRILPFGNGAERMLGNIDPGASVHGLSLTRHKRAQLYRAGLEGIACAFAYGAGILKDMGLNLRSMRVGNDNLFRSQIFSQAVSDMLDVEIEILETTGAVGAACAAGVATGAFTSLSEAMSSAQAIRQYHPSQQIGEQKALYADWERILTHTLKTQSQ